MSPKRRHVSAADLGIDVGRQELVDALGRGGYRRYDESTARELIDMGRHVLDEYGGHLSRL
jgi:hypothetical protein